MPTTLVPTVHERLTRDDKRLYVDGLITGAEVVLSIDRVEFNYIATGPDHTFIVPPLNASAKIKAKQDVGTGFTPWSPTVIVEGAFRPITPPTLPGVIDSCSESVYISNVVPGSQLELEAKRSWTDPQQVHAPAAEIKPTVLEALIEGDQIIRVQGQVPGAFLIIRIRSNESSPAEEFGPRPASVKREIALNEPLTSRNIVSVTQSLCGISLESDPVMVQSRPTAYEQRHSSTHVPVIISPLNDCGRAVQVSNLYPGAMVRVFQDGVPVGLRWAGLESSINVSLARLLTKGSKVTATQELGGVASPFSEPIAVEQIDELPAPRILRPVARGDTSVRVSNVTPGSHIVIRSGEEIIGELDAAETLVTVSTSPIAAGIKAKATLGNLISESVIEVPPLKSPCKTGDRILNVSQRFHRFGTFPVPAALDGDAFNMPIEGQLYFPVDAAGGFLPGINWPLVIIAHGYWSPFRESYKGYEYLAQHLVQWGMVVFSLNMDTVNLNTSVQKPHQYARAEIILHAIDVLLADPEMSLLINRQSIGLIGHSMAGEGVAVAQFVNESEARGYRIKGVVSIAPTRYRPEVIVRRTKYLQLFGSMDILTSLMTGTDAEARFGGFRIYDRAWRTKTHFWIYRGLHEPFNRVWGQETGTGSGLSAQDHELIAKCLVNAFFQDALLGQTEYGHYMKGTNLPQSLSHIEIHTQHSERISRSVIDNFGDADEQVLLGPHSIEKTTNSRNKTVNAAGAGLSLWQDIKHTTLTNSPHNTKGVELSWTSPDAVYLSSIGMRVDLSQVFALRIGQFFPDQTLNPVATPIDLFVTLSDGFNEATVRLGSVAQVPYPGPGSHPLCPMRTVRLPMDAFQTANPLLALSNIQSVMLKLTGSPTGHILADDFEVSV